MNKTLIYDGTFDGFLTAVYTVFDEQLKDVTIVKPKHYQPNIFIEATEVVTNKKQAKRVWQGLQLKVTKSIANRLYATFLSEIKGVEQVLLSYILYAYCSESFVYADPSNKDISKISQVSKMVFRARDKMEAIVKFQLTKDGIYFAAIEPEFNVLPLLLKQIKTKYPDREWILFDKKRDIGVYCKNGSISYIGNKEFFSKTSRLAKKTSNSELFLDSNHLRITPNNALKSVI